MVSPTASRSSKEKRATAPDYYTVKMRIIKLEYPQNILCSYFQPFLYCNAVALNWNKRWLHISYTKERLEYRHKPALPLYKGIVGHTFPCRQDGERIPQDFPSFPFEKEVDDVQLHTGLHDRHKFSDVQCQIPGRAHRLWLHLNFHRFFVSFSPTISQ